MSKGDASGKSVGGSVHRAVLGENSYGKSRVRLVKVSRDGAGGRHEVVELSVDVALTGDFEAVHRAGDNALCLPTDTMKNTVYVLAKQHPVLPIEAFARRLAEHFVSRNTHVASAQVRIGQVAWERVRAGDDEHTHCFLKGSAERQSCEVTHGRAGTSVVGGIDDLTILKSTDSAFSGYLRDEYTTLPETRDRIFATSMTARWVFEDGREAEFGACRAAIRRALIETFAAHKSESVQHTLFAMGEAALGACGGISSIRLSMPNKHCLLVDLKRFGMENANEVFVPTDEPHGLIEATIERG